MSEALKQFRAQYPMYDDMSDDVLAANIHKTFYADMSADDFNAKLFGSKESTLQDIGAAAGTAPIKLAQVVAGIPAGVSDAVTWAANKAANGLGLAPPNYTGRDNPIVAGSRALSDGLGKLADAVGEELHTDEFNRKAKAEAARPDKGTIGGLWDAATSGDMDLLKKQANANWEDVKDAAAFYGNNPLHGFAAGVESAPMMLAPMAAAKMAGGAGLSATKAAIATGAAMEGASAASGTRMRIDDMSVDDLSLVSPEFNNLLMQGMAPETAKSELARLAGGEAFTISAIASGIASKLTGAGKFEADVGTGGVGGVFKGGLRGGATEFPQEFVESGAGQYAENQAIKDFANSEQNISQGVLKAATQGGIVGMGTGATVGAARGLFGSNPIPTEQTDNRPDVTGKDGTDLLGNQGNSNVIDDHLKRTQDELKAFEQQEAEALNAGLAQAVQNAQAASVQNQQATAQAMQSPEVLQAENTLNGLMPQDPELQAMAAQGVPVIEITPPVQEQPQSKVKAKPKPEPVTPFGEVAEDTQAPEQNAFKGLPIQELPVDKLTLSNDVPQFKDGANESGVVEPLGGKFDRTGVAPIQVWQRNDGRMEVISGRHRLDLARRSGERTIPVQVHREADGFDATKASTLDAELNIRDGQGKVADYVQYFTKSNIDKQEAIDRGLLSRAIGKRSYAIATQGDSELIAAHRAGIATDLGAYTIATAFPNDGKRQQVALARLQQGDNVEKAVNVARALSAITGGDSNMDMFGFDDAAIKEAERMAKEAVAIQRRISEDIAAVQGAAKNPKAAAKFGVNVADPDGVKKRIESLKEERAQWDNWHTNPALVAQLRGEEVQAVEPIAQAQPSTAQDDFLTSYDESTIQAQEANAKALAQQQAAQQNKEVIDAGVDNFSLDMGNVPDDDGGATFDMFSAPEPVAQPKPTQAPAAVETVTPTYDTISDNQEIVPSKSGEPFKSEKLARLSATFKNTPNAEIKQIGDKQFVVVKAKHEPTQLKSDEEVQPEPKKAASESMEAPVANTEAQAKSLPQERIDDVGESIAGAKKMTFKFTDALTADVDIASVPLSKSFPKPDYVAMAKAGAAHEVLALVAMTRDLIPAKPKVAYRLKSWVGQVEAARKITSLLMENSADGTLAYQRVLDSFAGANAILKPLLDVALLASKVKPEQIETLSQYRFRTVQGKVNKSVMPDYDAAILADDTEDNGLVKGTFFQVENVNNNRERAYFLNYANAQQYILDAVEAKSESTSGEKRVDFGVFSVRGQKGYQIGKKVSSGKFITLETGIASIAEAKAMIANDYDRLKAKYDAIKDIPSERKAINNPRIGEDYRNGRDVTATEFAETFGFRGVQFGNYVDQGKRQEDLNNAYDGFMDLAGIIGVPPKALSLNGELGMAFGARGSGGKNPAKAHYEPDMIVINMTKANGSGSLAHEWFHALDNYFSRLDNEKGNSGFASEVSNPMARPEVMEAWKNLRLTIKNETQLFERSIALDSGRSKDYWSTVLEMVARSFERYVIDKLAEKGFESDYLANIIDAKDWDALQEVYASMGIDKKPYPYPLDAEAEKTNAAYDALFDAIETKVVGDKVVLFSKSAMKSVDANIKRGIEAMNKAITEKTNVHRAMYRNDIGWVDFVWGDEGVVKPNGKTKGAMGLSHIIEARMRKDGMTYDDVSKFLTQDIVKTIANGKMLFDPKSVGNSENIRLDYDGNIAYLAKNKGSNSWIITAFVDNGSGSKEAAYDSSIDTFNATTPSRSTKVAEPYKNTTTDTLTKQQAIEIVNKNSNGKRLLKNGKLVVLDSFDDAPQSAKDEFLLSGGENTPQGFFDPVTDTTYLVADALTADTINGVLVHEVGVHAWWAKANSDKKAALEKRAMQLLNHGKYGNEKIKAFYAAVEQRMIDADVQGNAEEAAAYIVEEAINQAGAERYALSDSRLIDAVAKVSKSLANWMSDFIAAIKASFNRIGWLNTANLTGADMVAIAKRNMRDVAQNDVGDNVGILAGNVAGNYAGVLASMASDTPTQAEIAQAQRDLDTQLAIADKLEAEYGYLPAPNGEKSNLNKQQWAQVRTPQFKEFYGDWEKEQRRNDEMARQSVEPNARTEGGSGSGGGSGLSGNATPSSRLGGVLQLVREEVRLDNNGEPKVYYHGTSDDVSAFDTNHKNRKDKGWLGRGVYATDARSLAAMYARQKQGEAEQNVMPLFVGVKNPYLADKSIKNKLKFASQEGIDSFTKELLSNGYDGVAIKFPNGEIELVAFNPNSVKSAISNVGTFSGKTGNIMFSKTGKAKSAPSNTGKSYEAKIGDDVRIDYQDDMLAFKRVQETLEKKTGKKVPDVYEAVFTFKNKAAAGVDAINAKVNKALEAMSKLGVTPDVMGLYLYAKGAKDRNAMIEARNGVKNGSGMSDARADQLLADLQQTYPDIDSLTAAWYDIIDGSVLRAEQTGLLTDGWLNENRKAQPFYVPMKHDIKEGSELTAIEEQTGIRPMTDFSQGIGKAFNLTGKEIKKANGRISEAGDILTHIVADAQRLTIRAEKNVVGSTLAKLATQHKDDKLWVVQKDVPSNEGKGVKDGYVGVKVKGNQYYIVMRDERLAKAAAGINSQDFMWLDHLNQFIKKSITAWNPVFTIINSARDTETAYINATGVLGSKGANKMIAYGKGAMKSIWEFERNSEFENPNSEWSQWMQLYLDAGGKTGFRDFRSIIEVKENLDNQFDKTLGVMERIQRGVTAKEKAGDLLKIGMNGIKNTAKWLEDLGAVTENVWRVAAFRVAIEQGKSAQEAAKIARELTVNFNRKGHNARGVERLFLFYNAAIQGTHNLASRAAKDPLYFFGKVGGSLLLLGVTAAMMGGGDDSDEWANIPEETKMRGIPFHVAGQRFVIPMAYGFGLIPYAGMKMVEMAKYEQSKGKYGVSVEQGMRQLVNATMLHFNPFGGQQMTDAISGEGSSALQWITPTVGDPLVQIYDNTNVFGKRLRPEGFNQDDTLPDSEKVFDHQRGTWYDNLAKGLNTATGGNSVEAGVVSVAPSSIKAWADLLAGGWGREIGRVITLAGKSFDDTETIKAADIPVLSVVWKQPTDADIYHRYSESTKALNEVKSTMTNYIKAGDTVDAVERQKFMSAHKEQLSLLLTPKAKDEVSKYLYMNGFTGDQFNAAYYLMVKDHDDKKDELKKATSLALTATGDAKMKAVAERDRLRSELASQRKFIVESIRNAQYLDGNK